MIIIIIKSKTRKVINSTKENSKDVKKNINNKKVVFKLYEWGVVLESKIINIRWSGKKTR